MKSVHNNYATKEDMEKMLTIGSILHPVTNYTKDDFLTPARVAQKFGISTEKAKEIMKQINFKKTVFALNGHKTPVIIRFNRGTLKLHPMAFQVFQEYIDNQKVK